MAATTDSPLDLVIRFSTSNPDIILTIDKPSTTTALSLKQQIRTHLDPPASTSRLRLIHAGKVLPDDGALSTSLHVTVPPPPQTRQGGDEVKSEKAKGKLPVRDATTANANTKPAARVYIHCSIGDTLTASELSAETQAAQEASAALASNTLKPSLTATTNDTSQNSTTTTTPAPRGFDRLLTAGFTPPEITHLRTQFLAIQAHTHTPDSMPSGTALLALEESWLDNSPSSNAAGGGEDTGGGFGSEDAGGLEDMLYGNLIGFFWPVGAMCWLLREEGVWSRRRQIAVLSGFLVNLTFGFLRVMN